MFRISRHIIFKTTFDAYYWKVTQHSRHILATSRQGLAWKCKALFPQYKFPQYKAVLREVNLWRLKTVSFEAPLIVLYLLQTRLSSLFFVIMIIDVYLRIDKMFLSSVQNNRSQSFRKLGKISLAKSGLGHSFSTL